MQKPEPGAGEGVDALARGRLAKLSLGLALAIVLAAAWHLRLPLFVLGPGPVMPVDELVTVEGAAAGPASRPGPGGEAPWLATITARQASVGAMVRTLFDPDHDLVPWSDLIPPGQDLEGFLHVNRRLMEESRLTAAYAAYRFLGQPAELTAAGVEILAVRPDSPAARAGIQAGDVVISIDGRPVTFPEDLAASVTAAGDRDLRWTLERGGGRVTLTIPGAGAASWEQFGVVAAARDLRGRFTPGVHFHPSEIAGPSAGLAFALYLVERLAPGTLPSDGPIAATGVVGRDGRVEPVGGVRYKARAVARAGARVFVVPVANAAEARAAAPDLPVVGVASLAEAVELLQAAPLTPFLSHPYNDAGLEAIPVAH